MLAILLGLRTMPEAAAQEVKNIAPGVSVSHFRMSRHGKYLAVEMQVDLTQLVVSSNRAVLLTPRLIKGPDSIDLPSIGVYGRRRYYYYLRNGMGSDAPAKNETVYKASKKPDNTDYHHCSQ